MSSMMNEMRVGVGLSAAALAATGYLHALDYARDRTQGRKLDNRNPNTPMSNACCCSRKLLPRACWPCASMLPG